MKDKKKTLSILLIELKYCLNFVASKIHFASAFRFKSANYDKLG